MTGSTSLGGHLPCGSSHSSTLSCPGRAWRLQSLFTNHISHFQFLPSVSPDPLDGISVTYQKAGIAGPQRELLESVHVALGLCDYRDTLAPSGL